MLHNNVGKVCSKVVLFFVIGTQETLTLGNLSK